MAYNYITNRDSPNYTPAGSANAVYGMARVIEGITIHWWGDPAQNPQFGNVVDYLCRANGNTSAHFVATGTNRQVACIVAPENIAWHGGTAWANARTIGIECDPRGRSEDFDVVAELVADIRSAYGDVPLYWHSYFYSTACPGVYRDKIEQLDQMSYTKFSAPVAWGAGGDKNPKAPTPPPPPAPTPTPAPATKVLWKLAVDGKQVGAYSTEMNAYSAYVYYKNRGVITLGGKDVTTAILAKYTTPSPTTKQPDGKPLPDTGLPVTDKIDYSKENNTLLKQILDFLKNIFKGG